jgi:hypothetical protein
MIIVSRLTQSMSGKKRIEKLESERGAHLAREAPLNVRGVNARCALDEDDRETEERPQKSLIREGVRRSIPRAVAEAARR